MDTRWWFVNQLVEEGLINVQFVRTNDNLSNIGTKNVTLKVYGVHMDKLLLTKQ
jgi:hypothetical protein